MAFLTKSHQLNSSSSSSTLSEVPNPVIKSANSMSDAAVDQKNLLPKRDQGLILDCVEGLNLTDYTVAVGDIVHPKNILYSSRISHNRVCLYLSSKYLVNDITDKHEFLRIGKEKVTIRPLIPKQQRVIISNVAPIIPHHVIEEKIDSLNIKRSAPITTLKATIAKDGYEHVLSSRRQTYINPSDVQKLPEFIEIIFDETTYYVYPSIDVLKCSLCKIEDHIAKHCSSYMDSNVNESSVVPSESGILENSGSPTSDKQHTRDSNSTTGKKKTIKNTHSIDNTTHSVNAPVSLNREYPTSGINTVVEQPSQLEISPRTSDSVPLSGTKRPLSSSLPSSSLTNTPSEQLPSSIPKSKQRKAPKRIKKFMDKEISIKDVADQLEPITDIITEDKDKYPLSMKMITEFLFASYGNAGILETALSFTDDIPALIYMLEDVYTFIYDRNLKRRINRIMYRLENTSQNFSSIDDTFIYDSTDDSSSTDESIDWL